MQLTGTLGSLLKPQQWIAIRKPSQAVLEFLEITIIQQAIQAVVVVLIVLILALPRQPILFPLAATRTIITILQRVPAAQQVPVQAQVPDHSGMCVE